MFCFYVVCSAVCHSECNEAVAESNEESQNCKDILPVGEARVPKKYLNGMITIICEA